MSISPPMVRSLVLSAGLLACASPERASQHPQAAEGDEPAAGIASAPVAPCPAASEVFCWLNPRPQGSSLAGVWAAREDEAWAVGLPGALLRWDGRQLATVPAPSPASLRAIWGSAADDVWAAGDVVLHGDGRAWTTAPGAPAGAWLSVHGSSRDDVWLVGADGAAAHFDGTTWRPFETGTAEDLTAVASISPTEAYAGARSGTVLRWDGRAWAPSARLSLRNLHGLFAPGPGEVWVAGEPLAANASAGARGTGLARLTLGAWASVTVPGLESATLTAVDGASGAEVWVVGTTSSGSGRAARFDGTGWQVEDLPAPALAPRAVRARPGALITVGDGGQVFVRRAGAWAPVHHGTPGYLQYAAASPAGEAWFSAVLPDFGDDLPEARLLRLVDGAVEAVPVGVADVLYGVWASGPDDVWAGTLANGFLHYDGQTWTPRVGGYAGLVDGVWASGPSDVWGVAGSYALHFDGTSLTRHTLPGGGARRIYGLSPNDVWAVGAAGAVQHWDGARWSSLPITAGPALAVWGSAGDDVWMVGEGGLAWHWDGQALARIETGTTATLWAVGGTSRHDVWAAGALGTVLHFDGNAFAPVASGTTNALGAIAVGAGGDLYVAGDFGTILRKVR